MTVTHAQKRTSPTRMGIIVSLVGVLLVIAGAYFTVSSSQLQEDKNISDQKVTDVKSKADPAADSVLALCQRTDEVGSILRNDPNHPCDKAAEVKQVEVPTTTVESLSPGQIRESVEQYFREHPLPPGQLPTLDQVMQGVATICANDKCKGADGKSATPEQIAQAVNDFCGESRCVGKPGKDVTPEMVATAVAAYCSAHNQCKGADSTVPGPSGAPGRSVYTFSNPQSDAGGCYTIITYDRPDPNGATFQRFKLPDYLCSPTPPTTTSTTSTTASN